jgi:hypothetical protein
MCFSARKLAWRSATGQAANVLPFGSFPNLVMSAAIIFIQRQKVEKQLIELAGVLEGHPRDVDGWFIPTLSGRFAGRPVRFRLEPVDGGWILHVQVECRSRLEFRIATESKRSRLMSRLHLIEDLQVGNPDLDARFCFAASDPAGFTNWLLASAEARKALEQVVVRDGLHSLALEQGQLQIALATAPNLDTRQHPMRSVLDGCVRLARTLEGAPRGESPPPVDSAPGHPA